MRRVDIGGRVFEEGPPDYHIRRGKRSQLYMTDLTARLRDLFQWRCTAVPNPAYHYYMTPEIMSVRTGLPLRTIKSYLVWNSVRIPDMDFDLILKALDISIRELVIADEYGPTYWRSQTRKTTDREKHLRGIQYQMNLASAFVQDHVPNPNFHKFMGFLGNIQEQVYALLDLDGKPRRPEDAGKMPVKPYVPDYVAENKSPDDEITIDNLDAPF